MKICKTVLARCSLEAEFNDFLGEEVIQALVQLSHDAVRLCFLWRRAARGLPLKETNRAQLFDDEFTLKGLTKQIPNIHPRVDLGMLETYVWPSGFRPLGFWPEFGVMFQSFVLHGRQLGQRGRFCVLWSRGRGEVFVVRWCSVQLWRRRKRRVLDVDRYLFQSFVEVKLQLWQAKTEGQKEAKPHGNFKKTSQDRTSQIPPQQVLTLRCCVIFCLMILDTQDMKQLEDRL